MSIFRYPLLFRMVLSIVSRKLFWVKSTLNHEAGKNACCLLGASCKVLAFGVRKGTSHHMAVSGHIVNAVVTLGYIPWLESTLPSPAKLLNQRDYRTQLPCCGRLQRSQAMECNQKRLQHRQDVQKQQYDGKSPRELQKLVPGQELFMFEPRTKTWVPVEVEQETTQPGSYVARTAGGSELRRNRVQLKVSGERVPTSEEQLENNRDTSSSQPTTPMATPHQVLSSEPPQTPHKPAQPTEKSDGPPMTTRSGRVVKKPPKLDSVADW